MSVRIMAEVWDTDLAPNEKLVLLAYADHADDSGASIYPGEDRIAIKTSYSRGNVRRITTALVASGLLIRVAPGRRGQRAVYQIDRTVLASHAGPKPIGAQDARLTSGPIGAQPGPIGAQPRAERRAATRGKARGGATPNHHEPSVTVRTISRAQAPAITDKDRHDALVWALVDAMGWERDEVPEAQWGRLHRAAKDLADIGADPADVPRRARVYQVNFRGATMTPNAIATNWPDLAQPRRPISRREVTAASKRAEAAEAVAALKAGEA